MVRDSQSINGLHTESVTHACRRCRWTDDGTRVEIQALGTDDEMVLTVWPESHMHLTRQQVCEHLMCILSAIIRGVRALPEDIAGCGRSRSCASCSSSRCGAVESCLVAIMFRSPRDVSVGCAHTLSSASAGTCAASCLPSTDWCAAGHTSLSDGGGGGGGGIPTDLSALC